ncbi:putative alkane 1-monooxygenase [Medicago truncatula]|uniref:Putative alkane 1-monooxygenase n=1 Tax=Medicago truncatula TaxID=3880 RepID=A0A396JNQ0_MEDTR|nr:putative alkane 1-monooxygenase [Medicago truncatula]
MEDDTFPNGIKLIKETKVIYAIFSMGRMESIRRKDCSEFKPERRLTKDIYFMSEAYYKFTIFNGGSRLCLGKDFAYYQTKYVAASIILFCYDVKVVLINWIFHNCIVYSSFMSNFSSFFSVCLCICFFNWNKEFTMNSLFLLLKSSH